MIGILGFVLLWGVGVWRGGGRGLWLLAALWWLVLLGVTAAGAEGGSALSAMARLVGGSFRLWLLGGVLVGVAVAYRALLRVLRGKAMARAEANTLGRKGRAPDAHEPDAGGESARGNAPSARPEGTADAPPFGPDEVARYSRHLLLHEIGGPGQQKLKAARVLVIGAGGLGAPALMYLAAAGAGHITVVDDDVVEPSNLQRQIIHTGDRIGMAKALSAARTLHALNPFISVQPIVEHLDEALARRLIADHGLVLDGSDNFDTRYLVNRVATDLHTPLIAAAMTQWEGQMALYDPAGGGPCYACVFPTRPAPGLVRPCAEAGIVAPLPGVFGALMAIEAIKHLTGAGETLRGRLLILDALHSTMRTIRTKARADCPVCHGAGGVGV